MSEPISRIISHGMGRPVSDFFKCSLDLDKFKSSLDLNKYVKEI